MTKDGITFYVFGLAKPAGSKRGFALKKGGAYTGRVAITDACKGSRDWKTTVSTRAREVYKDAPETGPLSVEFYFYMPRPKAHFNSRGEVKPSAPKRPTPRPDVLKLARGVEDALTGIIWKDDSQIVSEHIHKFYADHSSGFSNSVCTRITIHQVTE